MSFFAWIDFDQADRDRTRRIMDLFNSEDSRDELGLGSVRDALSDLMFPGTSTIQTRLRYMLFVPWIYQLAGSERGTAASRYARTRELEIALIKALLRGGETQGVIGREARENLKRLPSDVYWAGLHSLGIRCFQGSRNACLEVDAADMHRLWSPGLPEPPDGFLTDRNCSVNFVLTPEERGFLRDRLTQSAPNSLFTRLARRETAADCETVWQHPMHDDWPEDTKSLVKHAQLFSQLMLGAALLYNLMLAGRMEALGGQTEPAQEGLSATYRDALEDWPSELDLSLLADWQLSDLWSRVAESTHRVQPKTQRFITEWLTLVLSRAGKVVDDSTARRLVEEREVSLKRHKSRFRNSSVLARWGGASGAAPMIFRWKPVVSDHLRDLCNG